MRKYLPIYLYGATIIFSGIFLLSSKNIPFNVIRVILGIALTFGAVPAFISALFPQKKSTQFVYHGMHALAMVIYGVGVLLFANTPERLGYLTSFLLIFYTFSEIIFCNWLFNLPQKVAYKTLIVRLSLGFVAGIGTVVAISYTDFTLQIFGALFIMVGANIMLYIPILKKSQSNNVIKDKELFA